MIFAYLDESGIHDGAEGCVVAGYFSKKGPWRRLESTSYRTEKLIREMISVVRDLPK